MTIQEEVTFKTFMEEHVVKCRHLTSTWLQKQLQMSHPEICRRWLRGHSYPTAKYQQSICIRFGYDEDNLRAAISILKQTPKLRNKLLTALFENKPKDEL